MKAPQLPPPRAADDDPLPAPDEVPSFLQPQWERGASPGQEEALSGSSGTVPALPTHQQLVEPEAYLQSQRPQRDGSPDGPAAASWESEELPALPPSPAPSESEEAAGAAASPCQPLVDAIAKHQDYLRRIHDERRAFGWVEDREDGAALRLLESLRRCAEHPEDPDCLPPALEADLAERTLQPHEYSRDPSDLVAEGKDPDEIPHDPTMLDLLERLRRCEAGELPPPARP